MATTIKLKNGSGAPLAGDLVQGEPALDLTNKRLYTEDSGGTVIEVGTNPSTLTVDTTTLVVDAGNNRVGINNASPAQALDVVGTIKGDSTFLLSNATTSSFLQVSTNILQFGTSSSDPVAFYANNAERMRIDSSGDVFIKSGGQLKVERSGASNFSSFYTDTGDSTIINNSWSNQKIVLTRDGNVGIGVTSPFSPGGSRRLLQISNSTNGAIIAMNNNTDESLNPRIFSDSANLGFATPNTGSGMFQFYTAGTERMRIDSSGRLLIGKTAVSNSTAGYFLEPGTGGYASFVNTAASASNRVLLLNREGGDGAILECRRANTTVGKLSSEGYDLAVGNGDAGVQFVDGTRTLRPFNITTNARADNSIDLGMSTTRWKDLYLSGGAYLGGTGAANHLDDYEEGTWTPSIASGSASFFDATYTKVGRLVTVSCLMISITDLSSSTALQINGLPFTTNSSTIAVSVGLSRYFNRGNGTIVAYSGGNSNVVNFYALSAGADYLNVRHSDLNNANVNYYLNLTYQTT